MHRKRVKKRHSSGIILILDSSCKEQEQNEHENPPDISWVLLVRRLYVHVPVVSKTSTSLDLATILIVDSLIWP